MKKILFGFIAVFLLFEILSAIEGFLLMSTYESLASLWRPDMNRLMWVVHVMMVVGAFFFVFIFSKGYEGKGIIEGVRFGFYIGVWMGIGFAYGTYMMIAIPYWLAITWFFSSILQYILAGIVAAMVYGKTAMVTPVKPVA